MSMTQEEIEAQLGQLGGNAEGPLSDGDLGDAAPHDTSSEQDVAEARRLGWIPKDKYTGDPEKWKPANQFLEYGRERNTVLNERLRKQQEQNDKLQREVEELKKGAAEAKQFFSKVEENAYRRAKQELLEQKRQALESGDYAAAVEVDERIRDLPTPKPEAAKPEPAKPEPTGQAPEFQAWLGQNSWVNNLDAEAQADLRACIVSELQRNPPQNGDVQSTIAAFNQGVKRFRRMSANDPRGNLEFGGAAVPRNGVAKRERGFADLPPEAKSAAERLVKQRYIKDKEAYAKEYWASIQE